MNNRAWALITVLPDERQYGGNLGHAENYKVAYKYDTDVANHKQLAKGDLVVLRSKQEVLGVAEVLDIQSSPMNKTRQRCPVCGDGYIKKRKTRLVLPWRCGEGHEFNQPKQTVQQVTAYTAELTSYTDGSGGLVIRDLKEAAYRPNDQLSIEEIDVGKLRPKLKDPPEGWTYLLNAFLFDATISPDDSESDNYGDEGEYALGGDDQRQKALRTIKLRRGQPAFRKALRRKFQDRCAVSGCSIVALLEAAHIDPYRGGNSNHSSNGLLLRADLHTLFDLFMLSIHPENLTAHFQPTVLAEPAYAELEGLVLFNEKTKPSSEALSRHWAVFQRKNTLGDQPVC